MTLSAPGGAPVDRPARPLGVLDGGAALERDDIATLARAIALLADGATEPPKELRLFSAGYIDTTKGVFKFDEESGESVMKCWREVGRDYPFDYEHASLFAMFSPDPAESGKAAGWFKPAIRDGECWATEITWTPKARQKILDREFRYTSPSFRHDEGRILEIHSCALTNDPATKGAKPIVNSRGAAAAPASPSGDDKEKPMEKIIALLAARLGITATTEAEIIAALSRVQESETKAKADAKTAADALSPFLALSGKSTPAEALGVFQAQKAASEQVPTLSAKVAELEKLAVDRERDGLIEQGKKDGKLPPALETWAKAQPIESLKAFLVAAAPVVTPLGAGKKPDDKDGGETVTLTDEHRKIAAQIGVKPEDVAKRATAARA